jgi:CHAT domain-containing protein
MNLTTATLAKPKSGSVGKAGAFRRAMTKLINSPKFGIGQLGRMDKAHPAHWAPFIIVGDGR